MVGTASQSLTSDLGYAKGLLIAVQDVVHRRVGLHGYPEVLVSHQAFTGQGTA